MFLAAITYRKTQVLQPYRLILFYTDQIEMSVTFCFMDYYEMNQLVAVKVSLTQFHLVCFSYCFSPQRFHNYGDKY